MSSDSDLNRAIALYSVTAVVVVSGLTFAVARHRAVTEVVHLSVPPVEEGAAAERPQPGVLRVCADPNDLPFSNEKHEGFENAIAELVAQDLGQTLRYVWRPQRRGFIRNTLKANTCDVVMGVPAGFELARTTAPYYRSAYMFVERRGARAIRSLDDQRLQSMRIGVQIVGEDYDNPPPVQALAARGLADRVRGYMVYGNYASDAPQRALLDAVSRGDVDVAIAWGPLAGYFASRSNVPLALTAVPDIGDATMPFRFAIAMAVRREDSQLAAALDRTLARRHEEIQHILRRFGVPLIR